MGYLYKQFTQGTPIDFSYVHNIVGAFAHWSSCTPIKVMQLHVLFISCTWYGVLLNAHPLHRLAVVAASSAVCSPLCGGRGQ